MLTDRDKSHLQKLLSTYSFSHLQPPPEIYQNSVPQIQHFVQVTANKKRRKIFYRVDYSEQEEAQIYEVKNKMTEAGIFQNFPDQIILKHLYSSDHKVQSVLERLLKVQAFLNNPTITSFTQQTLKGLESGCIYTYGHDKEMKPIVIIRVDKFDFQKDLDENFNLVYFLMLVVLGFRTVPYHAEKYTCIFDCNNMNIQDIPYKYLYTIISAMNIYYCGNVQRTCIFNAKGIETIWLFIKKFLSEHALKKIFFFNQENKKEMRNFIDPYELQSRYGGKLEDLNAFWPPKCTNEEFDAIQILKMKEQSQTQDQMYSVCNDIQFFQQKNQGICASVNCTCRVF